eukprot:2901994-Pleurochrysis_carterae.AAC.7
MSLCGACLESDARGRPEPLGVRCVHRPRGCDVGKGSPAQALQHRLQQLLRIGLRHLRHQQPLEQRAQQRVRHAQIGGSAV